MAYQWVFERVDCCLMRFRWVFWDIRLVGRIVRLEKGDFIIRIIGSLDECYSWNNLFRKKFVKFVYDIFQS